MMEPQVYNGGSQNLQVKVDTHVPVYIDPLVNRILLPELHSGRWCWYLCRCGPANRAWSLSMYFSTSADLVFRPSAEVLTRQRGGGEVVRCQSVKSQVQQRAAGIEQAGLASEKGGRSDLHQPPNRSGCPPSPALPMPGVWPAGACGSWTRD
jgi:hypothetical protein